MVFHEGSRGLMNDKPSQTCQVYKLAHDNIQVDTEGIYIPMHPLLGISPMNLGSVL